MKTRFFLFTLLFLLLSVLTAQGQTSTQNYVRTRTLTTADGRSYLDHITYHDGLGRPFQDVQKSVKNGVRQGKNLATLTCHDALDRVTEEWLPVPTTADYLSPKSLKSQAQSAYGGDTASYAATAYRAAPVERLKAQYGPGEAWHDGHPVRTEYLTNSSTDSLLRVKRYELLDAVKIDPFTFLRVGFYMLSTSQDYAPGQLAVTKTTDEDGHVRYTFTDKQGRTVLQRAVDGTQMYDTYYVYDHRGLLYFVLQPMYQEDPSLEHYAFCYEYDTHGRCTQKTLPGASPVQYTYDDHDRLIYSQDGNQLSAGVCTYYEYDRHNRLVEQGEEKAGVRTPQIRYHYDSYDFIGQTGFTDAAYTAGDGNGRGQLTGTETAVLGTDEKLYTAYYYDIYGREVKHVQNNLLGGMDVTTTAYTFTGQPQTVSRTHTAKGQEKLTETYTYSYDAADRLLQVKHRLNSGSSIVLTANTYNDLGQRTATQHHSQTALRTTYAYNVRGWLTDIKCNGKFVQHLHYIDGPGTPQYNGNLSSMTWQTGSETAQRGYRFAYDALDRLTSATYGEGTSLTQGLNRFTEKIPAYDLNGNIKRLQRYGQTGATAYGLLDNLTFTLDGNRPSRVDDASTATAWQQGTDFKDGAKQAGEYAYDANGNLVKDLNKGISEIQYNSLNLPSKVSFSDGSTIAYVYAADGTKLRTKHVINGTVTTTDYCGNVLYENGERQRLLTGAGYVSFPDTKYHYYLQGHLGNNRVVADQSGAIEETNHYYPFGGLFASASSVQPYKYNGKELDTKKGLNWYDYGARMYDPALGRFTTNDRYSEKYYDLSTYQYGANNPVGNIDVNGDSIRIYTETNSNHGLGHAWMSVGEGRDMIVYTYGRYDGTYKGSEGFLNSLSDGPGVLARFTGEEAQAYNYEKELSTDVFVFTISDVPDEKMKGVLDAKFYSSDERPSDPTLGYYDNPNAHVIDEYELMNNNCAVMVSKALNEVGSNVLNEYMRQPTNMFGYWSNVLVTKQYNTPLGLQNHLKGKLNYSVK